MDVHCYMEWIRRKPGIDHYEISLDYGLWINTGTDTAYTFNGADNGFHIVEIKAFEQAGNSQVAFVNFNVNMSPMGGREYTDLAIIGRRFFAVGLTTLIYILKSRKKT